MVHHHHRHHRRRRQQQQGGKKLFTCKTTAKSTSAGRGAPRDKFLSTSKLLSITVWQMECILKLFAHGGHHNSVKSPAPSILCLRLSSCGPSSNPKHAIYAFLIIKLKLLFVFELKNEEIIESKRFIGPRLANFYFKKLFSPDTIRASLRPFTFVNLVKVVSKNLRYSITEQFLQ